MSELTGLSETDASNVTISSVSIAEGMPPSGVNNGMRAIIGALIRSFNRLTGKYASTGTTPNYVLTPSVALAAYVTGERYSFRANFTNGASATLNISTLGAKTLKKMTASGKANLASGDIQSGQPVTVEYDGTDLVMVTPVANVTPTAGSGVAVSGSTVSIDINGLTEDTSPDISADFVAMYDSSGSANKKAKPLNLFKQKPCFQAHKNATDQTGITSGTETKITFGTEEWDTGSHYDAANSKFLPTVAGKYRISANVGFSNVNASDGGLHYAIVYKNGSAYKNGPEVRAGAASGAGAFVTVIVDLNGSTDFVEIYASGVGSGNRTVAGNTVSTYFSGELI